MTGEEAQAAPPAPAPAAPAPAPAPVPEPVAAPSKGKGPMIMIIVIVLVVVLLLVFFLFMGGSSAPESMTAAEWNAEATSAGLITDYPSYSDGDTVTINGEVTNITATDIWGDYVGELDNVVLTGVEYDLSGFDVGDKVTVTFTITGIEALGITVEMANPATVTLDA